MLQHLLPVLLPSWRLFDSIGPAPMLQWAREAHDAEPRWKAFRPLPERRTLAAVLMSLAWAPQRNETLYLASCAERLLAGPNAALERRVVEALRAAAEAGELAGVGTRLHVRIMVSERDGATIRERQAWRASPVPLASTR